MVVSGMDGMDQATKRQGTCAYERVCLDTCRLPACLPSVSVLCSRPMRLYAAIHIGRASCIADDSCLLLAFLVN